MSDFDSPIWRDRAEVAERKVSELATHEFRPYPESQLTCAVCAQGRSDPAHTSNEGKDKCRT